MKIHRSVTENDSINKEIKKIALFNLALDFKKGGFYKRAVESIDSLLVIDKKNVQALKEKAKIYILLKNWTAAVSVYKKLSKITNDYRKKNFSSIYVEIAKNNIALSQFFKAKLNLKKSFDIYKFNSYSFAVLGDFYLNKGKKIKALEFYKSAIKNNPFAITLLRCKLNRVCEDYTIFLDDSYVVNICMKIREFIRKAEYEKGIKYLKGKIIKFPEEIILQKLFFVLNSYLESDLENVKKIKNYLKLKFVCTSCNIMLNRYMWQCPNCKNWLTLNYIQ